MSGSDRWGRARRRWWPVGRFVVLLFVLVFVVVAGCNGLETDGGKVRDRVSFVDALRASGLTVDGAGSVKQPFFGIPGKRLRVSGGALAESAELQTFEHETPRDAQKDLETIGPGVQPRNFHVNWVAPPHLYMAGRLVVLYVGDDAEVLSLLRRVLGSPTSQGE